MNAEGHGFSLKNDHASGFRSIRSVFISVHPWFSCIDRLPKEIAETSIKDWYDRLNRFKLPDLSAASASQS